MNRDQRHVIFENRILLVEQLNVDGILPILKSNGIFSAKDLQQIDDKPTNAERKVFFIQKLENVENGWNHLCNSLKECNQKLLSEKLENDYDQKCHENRLTRSVL